MSNSNALVESKSLRESYIDKVYILEKVKKLLLLPDGINSSISLASEFYEIHIDAIQSCITDNRVELEGDGLRILKGKQLISLKEKGLISKHTASFTILPRRALLRIGMLLQESEVASTLRTKLLDENEQKQSASIVQIPTELNLLGQISDAISQSFKAMVTIQNDLNETKKEVHETKEENKHLKAEIDDVKNGMVNINAPLRSQFNDAVRSYAKQNGLDWNAAYNNVYELIDRQFHVNIKRRCENRKSKGEKVKPLDIVEELNLLVPAIRIAKTLAG